MEYFWSESARRSPSWHDNHPTVLREKDPRKRIPIGTHGDDSGVFQHEKILILSWNSVAVEMDTLNNRILFGVIQHITAIPGVTEHEFYLVLAWSLNCMSKGIFPDKDMGRQGILKMMRDGASKHASKLAAQ